MKRFGVMVLFIVLVILINASCSRNFETVDFPLPDDGQVVETAGDETGTGQPEPEKEIDLQKVKPNEVGKIMVLMYHRIGEKEDEWCRNRDNFRKDLEILYKKGYRLISLNDYLNNNINVDAGYTPVVLTFDDGTRGQFNVIEGDKGFKTDPDCAVGILESFYQEHPDFGLKATFYIYYPVPFRQKEFVEYKLKYLVEKGMDIGNHTYNHANLGKLGPEGIQYQLGRMVEETCKYIPGYQVNSLALPYGVNGKEEYREYVYKGEYQGVQYQNRAVLLVGSNPAPSPVDKRFNPYKIPRIRGTRSPKISTDLYDWLEYFDKNPHERYISDGDPDTVTVPQNLESRVDMNKLGDKKLRVY